jgi:hypothetical protein
MLDSSTPRSIALRRTSIAFTLLLAMFLPATRADAAAAQLSHGYKMPATATVNMTAASCTNRGSDIEISGTLATAGLDMKMTLKNNVKGTHTVDSTSSATLSVAPAGGSMVIPKQPVRGGVGGNPWISFQFLDANNNPLGQRVLLGRCIQGTTGRISQQVLIDASAMALAQAMSCSNTGSSLSFDGSRRQGALKGRLFLDNNYNKVVHQTAGTAASVTLSLSPEATIRKGYANGVHGPGGNPWIYLQFLSEGAALTAPTFVGRCQDLR